jgi:ABC-2 type transport system ATP-binding protein
VEDRSTLGAVGYVHESQAFPCYLTAANLLEFYAALNRETGARVRRRVAELLDRFGLADRSHEPIARFSKGMLQRLALAQSLVSEPRLLVLDEPSEGMDLLARGLLYETLIEQRRLGRSTILVSHSLADAQRLCDRVAVVRAGRIAYLGTLEALELSGQRGSLEATIKSIYADVDASLYASSLAKNPAETAWLSVDVATRGLELMETQP